MSESTLLITASASMLGLSLLVAGGLLWLDAGHALVITGGTIAGIAAYVAINFIGGKYVQKEVLTEDEQNA
jgi:hypothetical protein